MVNQHAGSTPRKLIVLCDGTFNDSSAHTNVFQFKNALVRPNQLVYYDEGVGITEEGDRKGWFGRTVDSLAGGAFGSGLSRNVQQAYRWVCDNYADGDELYFLGFSRGAYTARSVVGMIRNIGLIRTPVDSKTLRQAFKVYRSEHHPDCPTSERYRQRLNTRPVESLCLRFVGVWDTVGALGIPVIGPRSYVARKRWAFHDTRLSKHVVTARQALAVDEKRASFLPSLWKHDPERERKHPDSIEQRWFAGCHSDVGGSAGELAFRWMLAEAREAGLVFHPPLDQLAPPRRPQVMHESLSWFYQIGTGSVRRPIGERVGKTTQPRFHNEVVDPSASDTPQYSDGKAVPEQLRKNLQQETKMLGPEPGYGLTLAYYLGQYDNVTATRKPCCDEYRKQLLKTVQDHGAAGRWDARSALLEQLTELATEYPTDAVLRHLLAEALSDAASASGKLGRDQERSAICAQLDAIALEYPNDEVVREQAARTRTAGLEARLAPPAGVAVLP